MMVVTVMAPNLLTGVLLDVLLNRGVILLRRRQVS
jgi:hypothetical protein